MRSWNEAGVWLNPLRSNPLPMKMRFSLPLVISAVVLMSSLFPQLTVQAQATAKTFHPSADAYVMQSSPTSNYGTAANLRVDGSPILRSYLRFTVSGLSGAAVQSAKLRLYANSTAGGLSVNGLANNSWTETGLTFANAPAPGNAIKTSAAATGGQWLTIDISSYVKAEGTYNLVLTPIDATNFSLGARETGANAPQLVITTASVVPNVTAVRQPTAIATWQPSPIATKQPVPTTTTTASPQILLLAGDICKHNMGSSDYTANCKQTGDLVRSVLAANPGAQVQTLGDQVNNDPSGSYDSEYTALYDPAWGSFLNVTHSVVGNHDTYPPGGMTPYFTYFGSHAGPKPGYYSYNIGSSWHVIVLNSECSKAGGCNATSAQTTWLKNDLAANTRKCVLAAWHIPRWTSGRHPDSSAYATFWDVLYQYKVDIIANGHNHNYERFNLINPSEQAAADGIREFILGIGGAPGDGYTYASHPLDHNEAVRNQSAVYGVLQLTLNANSYSWEFLRAAGSNFTDLGTTTCH